MKFLFYVVIGVTYVCFFACSRLSKNHQYKRAEQGHYIRLITFETKETFKEQGHVARLSVEFATQNDSVFWDSFNNLRDQFYSRIDSAAPEILSSQLSSCSVGDSVELLIPPQRFFTEQFGSEAPPFVNGDSIVKVRFRIVEVFDSTNTYLLSADPDLEKKQIDAFFGSKEAAHAALDPDGFYWIGKKKEKIPGNFSEKHIKIRYRGSFLNGRSIDKGEQELEFQPGVPDQVLPGLNYVIQRLKMGENAKIILPSRLAFGDEGSSDGSVPAGTPLIYEIKIISK